MPDATVVIQVIPPAFVVDPQFALLYNVRV